MLNRLFLTTFPTLQRSFSSTYPKGVADPTRVFITNIADSVRWTDLKDHFKIFGVVHYASVSEHRDGTPKGVGIIQYDTPDQAEKAILNMHNHPLHGQVLAVRQDRQDRNKRRENQNRENYRQEKSREYLKENKTKSPSFQKRGLLNDNDIFGGKISESSEAVRTDERNDSFQKESIQKESNHNESSHKENSSSSSSRSNIETVNLSGRWECDSNTQMNLHEDAINVISNILEERDTFM